jgi:uncharacterized membrane protein YphA (DoxX/SURF4 family)
MKILIGIIRLLVGVLFIISGLIKLNDPVGFSFKLQEYFAPEVLNLGFLIPYALLIAIFVVIYEVLLGVMILIGYAKKFTLWSILLMIIFFTFLTFYSAYFNKVTDCGCFGDALKLTPWESFTKDIILLVLILILYFKRDYIQPLFNRNTRSLVVFIAFIGCLAVTYQVLQHLPIKDFRGYKIGANIIDGMTAPEGAQKAVFDYKWKFMVDGQETIVTTSGDYPKQDGEFISVETTEIEAGYEPPIHDFSIEKRGTDFMADFMEVDNLIIVIAYNLDNAEKEGFKGIMERTNEAIIKGYTVIGMSASSDKQTSDFIDDFHLNFEFYLCDETALKTIVRSNPGILALEKGTITQKLHWNDVSDLQLETLATAKPNLDFNLKRQLDSIAELDQRYRNLMAVDSPEERKVLAEEIGLTEEDYSGDLWGMQSPVDSSNMVFVEQLFKKSGYPGITRVGKGSNEAAWYVLQHNPAFIPEYFPLISEAGEAGELAYDLVAMMEDRYLMSQGKEQIYGTQGMSYNNELGPFIWPIEDPENVNERRNKVGLTESMEEYSKRLFGEGFEYKVLTLEDIKQ